MTLIFLVKILFNFEDIFILSINIFYVIIPTVTLSTINNVKLILHFS